MDGLDWWWLLPFLAGGVAGGVVAAPAGFLLGYRAGTDDADARHATYREWDLRAQAERDRVAPPDGVPVYFDSEGKFHL